MRRWVALILVGVSLALPLLGQSATGQANSMAGVTPATTDLAGLQERIARILETESVPGAAIALASRDGVIWAGGVGLADVSTGRPVDARTPFRLGSVTKNVTALAVMQQVERGRLSLDAHLRDVAPEVPFSNRWETTNPVTIAQLLEHTAGFDLYRFNDDVDYGPIPRPLLDALAVNPAARESRWPPGTRASYSNEGYTAAGYVLQKVTGRSFDDLMHEEIFVPLGMEDSAFLLTPDLKARLAVGYSDRGRDEVYAEDMNRPAANFISSADDMSRYLLLWLRNGQVDGRSLLSATSMERMRTRATLPYAGPDAQYGLGTDTAQIDGYVGHGHTGIQLGFLASLRYFSQGFGWVIMLNAQNGQALAEIESELLAFAVSGTQSPPPTVVSPEQPSGSIAGVYRNAAPMQEIFAGLTDIFGSLEIEVRPDGVWERSRDGTSLRGLVVPPAPQKLIPVGTGGAFRLDGESISSRFFSDTADGRDVLVTQLGLYEKTDSWMVTIKRLLILGALLLLTSGLVLAPVAIFQTLLPLPLSSAGGWLHSPGPGTWVPMVLLAAIAPGVWVIMSRSAEPLAMLNATTVTIFILSIAFPVLALASAVLAARAATSVDLGILIRSYLLLVAASGLVLTVFAWSARWLGLRTWAW
jgi:CubicO group peptidase (beta-lactamase class C family)